MYTSGSASGLILGVSKLPKSILFDWGDFVFRLGAVGLSSGPEMVFTFRFDIEECGFNPRWVHGSEFGNKTLA